VGWRGGGRSGVLSWEHRRAARGHRPGVGEGGGTRPAPAIWHAPRAAPGDARVRPVAARTAARMAAGLGGVARRGGLVVCDGGALSWAALGRAAACGRGRLCRCLRSWGGSECGCAIDGAGRGRIGASRVRPTGQNAREQQSRRSNRGAPGVCGYRTTGRNPDRCACDGRRPPARPCARAHTPGARASTQGPGLPAFSLRAATAAARAPFPGPFRSERGFTRRTRAPSWAGARRSIRYAARPAARRAGGDRGCRLRAI
jgi:hypothetical protein